MTRARLLRVVLIVALAAAAFAVPRLRTPAHAVSATGETLPNLRGGPRPAFAPGKPQLLSHGRAGYWWATVMREVTALRAPGGGGSVATLSTLTPAATTHLALVIASARRHG